MDWFNIVFLFLKQRWLWLLGRSAVFTADRFEAMAFFLRNRFTASALDKPDDASPDLVPEAPAWKERMLSDFRQWISEIDTIAEPALAVRPESCDFYALLHEFTVLRQTINMQNREQLRTVKALQAVQDETRALQAMVTRFDDRTAQIEILEENIRQACETRTVKGFFDIRDALVRGTQACTRAAAQDKGFFRRTSPYLDSIGEGYEMALRKFDAVLAATDIYPLPTDGFAFDPNTMKAIGVQAADGTARGIVVETVAGGFQKGAQVLRYAQVIVAG